MKFFLILVPFLVSGEGHVHLAPEKTVPAVPLKTPATIEETATPAAEERPAHVEKPQKQNVITLASAYARASKAEPLPAQGFEGSKVEHENMETQTKDWRKEYGPNSGQSTAYPATCPTIGLLLLGMLLM